VTRLSVAFNSGSPLARWGPLFHVFRLEQPDVRLDWRPVGLPTPGRLLLERADVGLFIQPPQEADLRGLTLDTSAIHVVMAAGHRLAEPHELKVADILDEPFPGAPALHPGWSAFWTLDEQRGAPAKRTDDDVRTAEDGLSVVAAERAIAIVPAWTAIALAHPGVVTLPLADGPSVATRLIWRAENNRPAVLALVELAIAWASAEGASCGRNA